MISTTPIGRMVAMERLLTSGNFSELSAEEARLEKLAAKTIHKEMNEADEANLLEEEDMHVFDCKPMTDPLHLVCCNACKKPIKSSQYAAHAERCKSLNSAEDTGLELDGGAGHKKPPRKGRKKIQTAHDNPATANGEQERSESLDGDDAAASESANMDDHTGMASSLSREVKSNSRNQCSGISSSMDGPLVIDGSGVSPGSGINSGGVMSPSKRAKLMPAECMTTSDGQETRCGVVTETGTCCQGSLTCRVHSEPSKRSVAGRQQPYDVMTGRQKPLPLHVHDSAAKDDICASEIPVPLATKMYPRQRSYRLRAALGHLYREALAKEQQHNDPQSPKQPLENSMISSQVLSPNNMSHEARKEAINQMKNDLCAFPVTRKPDQLLAQSSELCLGLSGGYSSVMGAFPGQLQDNNNDFARPAMSVDANPMGIMRTRYISTPYSFPGNSGAAITNMQQPNGIVPVI
ncbi:hypothetical protein AMTRI_Chr02g264400 [Amborella trichopoda]